MQARAIARLALALAYGIARYLHLATPRPFLGIMPGWIPAPAQVVFWTGIAELLGAAALANPWNRNLRKAGAAGLALYAICVFPANVNHFAIDMTRDVGGLGLAYHMPRMIAQPLIVWLTLWSARWIDWPFSAKRR